MGDDAIECIVHDMWHITKKPGFPAGIAADCFRAVREQHGRLFNSRVAALAELNHPMVDQFLESAHALNQGSVMARQTDVADKLACCGPVEGGWGALYKIDSSWRTESWMGACRCLSLFNMSQRDAILNDMPVLPPNHDCVRETCLAAMREGLEGMVVQRASRMPNDSGFIVIKDGNTEDVFCVEGVPNAPRCSCNKARVSRWPCVHIRKVYVELRFSLADLAPPYMFWRPLADALSEFDCLPLWHALTPDPGIIRAVTSDRWTRFATGR
jgi:hypothetical protein